MDGTGETPRIVQVFEIVGGRLVCPHCGLRNLFFEDGVLKCLSCCRYWPLGREKEKTWSE
ncbi:MAG: hypothetical protein V3S82_07235 [Dehalococcoidia bacterium]